MHSELLKQVPLFEGLSDNELRALSEVAMLRVFPKDRVVIMAEEEGDSLFVIHQGKVKVSIGSEDGREVILSILGEGDFFGEMSLLDGLPRSANVTTTQETELLMVRRADFLRIQRSPQTAIKLLSVLASRLRKTDRKIEGLALSDVTGRITQTLLQLAEEQGSPTPDGVLVKDRPTHQDLASMSGTTRETVSRILKRLENRGYVFPRGKDLLIVGPTTQQGDGEA
ncbi:MAG: Crp/Fnr family transcriptional regulator [Candidatus Latescibacterota bacterium]|nr:Crp/Fnr family transcriptional regulator [Candidatus Latescibacterota bacterium]